MDLFQIIDLGIIISIGITALFIVTLFLAKRKSTKEKRADLALLSIASLLHIVQLLIMLSGIFDSGGLNFYLSAAVNISGLCIGLFTFYKGHRTSSCVGHTCSYYQILACCYCKFMSTHYPNKRTLQITIPINFHSAPPQPKFHRNAGEPDGHRFG